MNREIIDKCLDFAEGKKGTFTILTVKKPDFPENLISGTEKQQTINGYVKEGYSTRQIAEIMGCSQPNIVEHLRQYKKSVAFYDEWTAFWGFVAEVRQTPIRVGFGDMLSEEVYAIFEKKEIQTVEDFLLLSVRHSTTKMIKILGQKLTADKKAELFQAIKEKCYDLLTVSND